MKYFDNPKEFLSKYGLAPSKKRGQNFLVNPQTAQRIVHLGEFNSDDHVLEVGVGFGALTSFLAGTVSQVTGVEIDRGIIRFHESEKDLPENVELIHGDILRSDFAVLAEEIGTNLKIIANLPYSISNPFIFKLIENRYHIDTVTVMLQKEVADRLTAAPATKSYGIPTVLLGSCARVKKLLTLKPGEFFPRPKIDSEIIRITFSDSEECSHFSALQKIVRTAFANRRKTLLNNLSTPILFPEKSGLKKSDIKLLAERIIKDANLSPTIRAEVLTIDQFQELASVFHNYSGS